MSASKLTAETITDAQIRKLYNDGAITFDRLYRAVHRQRLVGESDSAFQRSRRYARGLCAVAWVSRRAP